MPDFTEYFIKSQGKPIQYEGRALIMGDDIPFADGDRFCIQLEKTNSEWRQGIVLFLFGFIEIEDLGMVVKERAAFFEDTAPKRFFIRVWSDNSKRKQPKKLPKKGILGVKNAWDTGKGTIESWYWGAAMITEEIDNGKRYYCNDGHPDDNFDDLVFTIQKVS